MKHASGLALVVAIAIRPDGGVLAEGVAAVKLEKAGLAAEVKNDQRVVLVPGAGKRFLWVTVTASGAAQSMDLTKVVLAAGSGTFPLIGVDSAWDGDHGESTTPSCAKSAGSTSCACRCMKSTGHFSSFVRGVDRP